MKPFPTSNVWEFQLLDICINSWYWKSYKIVAVLMPGQWHLIVALICIFLITNDAEPFLICLLKIWISPFMKYFIQIFAHFFFCHLYVQFFFFSFVWATYIVWMQVFIGYVTNVMCILSMFSTLWLALYSLLMLAFVEQMFQFLMKCNWSIFSFIVTFLWLKKMFSCIVF